MKEKAQDFSEFVTDLRGGICHQELSLALQEVTAAAMQTGKQGTVTLQIKIKPQGSGQAAVFDTIKKVVPEPAKPETFMFVDDESNLVRSDPAQMNLSDLKEVVDIKTGELRKVGNE